MSIKYNAEIKTYTVTYSKRHPVTRKPISLKRIGIQTKREADRTFQELIIKVEERINRQVYPTWPEVCQSYFLERNQESTLKSIYSEQVCVAKYSVDWSETTINRISYEQIAKLKETLKQSVKPSSEEYVLKCFKRIFNYCLERKYVTSNPIQIKRFRWKNKIQDVLTKSQVEYLLHSAQENSNDWYCVWAMALYTGMRNGELFALTWHCVDLENSMIKVSKSWNNKDGFKCTKSGHDRKVNISPYLVPILKDLYATRIDDFVLPRIPKWEKGEQARELRAFLMGIGLPRIRFHDLRASWATIALSEGVLPAKVQVMGGWQDMKTMMIYMRKAGIDIAGALGEFKLHSSNAQANNVVSIHSS